MARARKREPEPVAQVDWLQRDKNIIEGLDQLGLWAVSVNLYRILLPGLTNVTERARYYAFYPWVLHRFAQASPKKDGVEWKNWIRRLDLSYALSSIAHDAANDSTDSTAVVGADTARRLLRDRQGKDLLDVRSFTEVAQNGKVPKGSYFKNPQGGYGQYYKSVLKDMGILQHDPEHTYPDSKLTLHAGLRIAKSLDLQPAFKRLRDVAEAGKVRVSDLAAIGADTNPSAIEPNGQEEKLLRSLFLGEDDSICAAQYPIDREWRRRSLLLGLQFVYDCGSVDKGRFANEFRWTCTEGILPDGTLWKIPNGQTTLVYAWGAYHRNDLLIYALESLFWVLLRKLNEVSLSSRAAARLIAEMVLASINEFEDMPATLTAQGTVSSVVQKCTLPEGAQADLNAASTSEWYELLENAVLTEDEQVVPGHALRLLARLATDRGIFNRHPFEHLPGAEGMAAHHEVHLGAWLERTTQYRDSSLKTFVEDLVLEWIIYRHLKVATGKLSGQGVSTFKFRPEKGHLVIASESIPRPTFTGPRLRQAERIMCDLHFLKNKNNQTHITEDGLSLLASYQ